MVSFIFGGDTGISADDLKRQRAVAEALLSRAKGAPRNVGEGLAAIGNALAYRMVMDKADKGESARRQASQGIFDDLIGGGSSSTMPTPGAAGEMAATTPGAAGEMAATTPGASTSGGDMQAYRDAIASIESAGSGDYQAVGPTHSKLGRALGRYQVMEANIGPWSQEALGKAISADEFLANPELQDRIFDHKFKGYVDQFGPEGAAQAWFAGPGGVGKGDRKDSLGTSVSAYADKFSRALGGAGGDQVASLDPAAGMAEGAIVPGAEPIVPMEGQGMSDTAVDGQNPAVAAIDAQTTALPVPGQAEQTDGIMQAVNGTNTGGTFGLNPMQQEVAQAVINRGGPTLEKLLRAAADPRLTDEHRAVVNAMLEREMAKEQAERERLAKQADPEYKLDLEKKRLEVENLRNPRLTPADTLAREKFEWERGEADRTTDIKDYEFYADREIAAGRQPLGPLEWSVAQRKASANTTTNIVGGEGDKFYENLDKKNAETFAALSDTGMQARAKMAQIDRLDAIMRNAPQGAVGALKQAAGEWGIATDGLSDIQAASALLEKMVPEQRAPGSGPMSDADIKMFRASLPRILNQPGGNELIFETMRGIAQYETEMGAIADRVADREITPADGRRLIRELKNPLAEFKVPEGSTPNSGRRTSTGVEWSVE